MSIAFLISTQGLLQYSKLCGGIFTLLYLRMRVLSALKILSFCLSVGSTTSMVELYFPPLKGGIEGGGKRP